jgi:hypothetical protein
MLAKVFFSHQNNEAETFMNHLYKSSGGLQIATALNKKDLFLDQVRTWCDRVGASPYVEISQEHDDGIQYIRIYANDVLHKLCQHADTSRLAVSLGLLSESSAQDMALEIVLSMAVSPVIFDFSSLNELEANLRMRINVVPLARRTELNFDTSGLSRPEAYWSYVEGSGFILKEGAALVDGIERALCPDLSGEHFSFSCQRATEYLMLHSLAIELSLTNPEKLKEIELQWRKKALVADDFLNAFLLEIGSSATPFPMRCYVPGDRVWFKNPDDFSSNVKGYEGSWVIYMGGGQFTNLWDKSNPYTLETKCIEIYHWRNSVREDKLGRLVINEDLVKELVDQTLSSEEQVQNVIDVMMRYRDTQGVYQDGGCIDLTRDTFRRA